LVALPLGSRPSTKRRQWEECACHLLLYREAQSIEKLKTRAKQLEAGICLLYPLCMVI
jgi:hypothetical protein